MTDENSLSFVAVDSTSPPNDLTIGPDGALWYVAGTDLGTIDAAGRQQLWSVPGAKKLQGIIRQQDHLWVADSGADMLVRIDRASWTTS